VQTIRAQSSYTEVQATQKLKNRFNFFREDNYWILY